MPHERRYIIILIFIGIVTGVGSIAANVAANTLPEWAKPYIGLAFPIFIVCVIVGILLAVYQWRSDHKPSVLPPATPQPLQPKIENNQSGGVEIKGDVVNVYGDITGRDKEITNAATSDRPVDAPPRSIWYLAHPYPMPAHFTGRAAERSMLTDWLNNDREHPLLVLQALGGFGKSALTWYCLTNDVNAEQWPNVIWWSFYEGDASFENFLRDSLKALRIDPPDGASNQVDALLNKLRESETLLVLDGFERLLRASSGMNAAYQGDEERREDRDTDCVNLNAEHLIRSIATLPKLRGKVLMTTRLTPRALYYHSDQLQGCKEVELTGLNPTDAVAYFHARKIKGTHTEIESACKPYEYHPLSLSLLAGLIVNDLQKPCDIVVAQRLNVMGDLKQQQHHVLEVAYNSLTRDRQKLLSKIACFRSGVSYEALHALAEKKNEKNFDNDLRDLLARGLLHRDDKTNRYDLHPIVRRYAYDRLTANDRTTAHTQLRDYFAAVPTPSKIQTLDDLLPVIELYHHTANAGHYDAACDLFYERINKPTYYQFGAYQMRIELLRALFPDGEDRPPRLTDEAWQAWTLNGLANSYSLSGQPRRAVPLFEQHNAICEKAGNKKNLAIGFGNVASMAQIYIGALQAAEANLRRSIDLLQEIQEEWYRGMRHAELGRLLLFCSNWQEAEKESEHAEALFVKNKNTQYLGILWAYRSLRALLMARTLPSPPKRRGAGGEALSAARRALELADETARIQYPYERDYVRAHWLLGTAHRLNGNLIEAERHLNEALTRCRNINNVESEADILIDLARLRVDQNDREEALRLAGEALLITERSEYALQGADVHLLMAQLALDADNNDEALQHAREARRLATCDGEPYVYRVAYDEAGELLKKLA